MGEPKAEDETAGPGRVPVETTKRIASRATLASVAVAFTLVATKFIAWRASDSVAMLASLADSALDLAASLTVLIAIRYAAKPADAEHRYGHGKAEALASLVQGALVTGSAGYLIYESVERFLNPRPISQSGLAAGVMAFALALTLALIWIQSRAVRRTGSLAVSADRAHYAADVGGHLAVLAGIIVSGFLGLTRADPIVGAIIALWLLYTAWGVVKTAFDHLMDRELCESDRARIKALAEDDPRVLGVHGLRTRAAGPLAHIQMHMDLDPALSLAEAHRILVAAERRIQGAYPAADILIHPDPKRAAEPHGGTHFQVHDRPPSRR